MATNIDDLVSRLQKRQSEVAATHKVLNERSAREQTALHYKAQDLGACICGLTSAPRELEAEQARNTALVERRLTVSQKETELRQAIENAPDWRLIADRPEREQEQDRQRTLRHQLRLLREGSLLFAPNEVYPRIEDLDARLKNSNERIEKLHADFAAQLQRAEALLAEPVAG